MEQGKVKKIKPCIVKLNRLGIMEDPDILRDRILDQRIRKCHVLVRRCDFSKLSKAAITGTYGQFIVRHCCVRLPKLNLELSDVLEGSSPTVLSDHNFDGENGIESEDA